MGDDQTVERGLSRRVVWAIAVVLVFVGAALRVYRFPSMPAGFHQDELSQAYESYCLLHTGADRWGIHLPMYFVSWGSGANALGAYLTIPATAIWGLTPLATRFVALFFGLLSLPLFFVVLRRWFGDVPALLGLLLLALTPWHIMLSRWGLEYNSLPFFFLLGFYLFERALRSGSAWAIVPCLLPFAVVLYDYGLMVLVVPVLLPLLYWMGRGPIRRQGRAWLGAAAVFLTGSVPMAIFLFKNYITKRGYSLERRLPFTVPLMPFSRLTQVREERGSTVANNLRFLLHGLQDGYPWSQVPGHPPIAWVVLFLAAVGVVWQVGKAVKERRVSEPFLPWLVASFVPWLVIPVKIQESISLFMPLLAMAAIGGAVVFGAMRARWYRVSMVALFMGLFLFSTVRFVSAYFGAEYAAQAAPAFHPDLANAMAEVRRRTSPEIPVYISQDVRLNYVQTLFYMKVDAKTFQHSGATYAQPDFGPYRFSRATAARMPRPFVFLIDEGEAPLCGSPGDGRQIGEFFVGECR